MNDSIQKPKLQPAADLPPHAGLNNPYNGLLPLDEPDSILEVRGIAVSYGDLPALDSIYCHFPERSVTAIMGPSGCGKSTFIKTLNRSLELTPNTHVTDGTVFYHRQDLYAPEVDPKAVRKHIGIIHQRPIVFPMSIMENVLFGARFHGTIEDMSPREYGKLYLDKVGLLEEVEERLDEPGSRLSGGQQQRLCLARTLANKPEIILMDEPCSAIDPVATQRIEGLIAELKADYTIIIVTHNIAQAKRVSDQAILMVAGKIIEAGSRDTLFNNCRTELARNFLSGQIG